MQYGTCTKLIRGPPTARLHAIGNKSFKCYTRCLDGDAAGGPCLGLGCVPGTILCAGGHDFKPRRRYWHMGSALLNVMYAKLITTEVITVIVTLRT